MLLSLKNIKKVFFFCISFRALEYGGILSLVVGILLFIKDNTYINNPRAICFGGINPVLS